MFPRRHAFIKKIILATAGKKLNQRIYKDFINYFKSTEIIKDDIDWGKK